MLGTGAQARTRLADGRHRVLVRAPSRKVLAVADPALDLLILELVLHGDSVRVGRLVLGVLAPRGRGPEDNVLADRGCVRGRPSAVRGRRAELGPRLALGHARVHNLTDLGEPDTPRRLYLLSLLVQPVGDDCLRAILVGDGLWGRKLGQDLVDVLVIRPVVSGHKLVLICA